jgi:hypothetical protein
VLILATIGVAPVLAAGKTWDTETTGDALDANLLDGSCETASGDCSLWAAIRQANSIG